MPRLPVLGAGDLLDPKHIPAGTGSTWRSGIGAPGTALGKVGDWYLNTSTGDYSEKTAATTWTPRGNLTGPTGPPGASTAPEATPTVTGTVRLTGDLAGTATAPTVARVRGVAIPTTAPATGQVLTASGAATAVWATPDTGGTGTGPIGAPIIRPANGTTDIGPAINNALSTYGAAIVAAGQWTLNTRILMPEGSSLLGYGPDASELVAGTALTTGGMVQMATGTSAHCYVDGLKINANGRADYAVYFYATGAPASTSQVVPDFVHTVQNCHLRGATIDGIYVGGSDAYSGNCRETRIRNCLVTNNTGWGVTVASSDMFLSDITCHGNGPGGFRTTTGVSGNTKFNHCKAYYEVVGIDASSSRTSIVGGEIQDCDTGIRLGQYGYLATVIDTCGTATTAGLVINGTGSSFALHMCRRSPPAGAPTGTTAIQVTGTSYALGGYIWTGVAANGANDYQTIYMGANRPGAGSTLTVS